jgi:RNA polymerase sigma-32 factor
MSSRAVLPVLSSDTGLTRYMQEIRKFPMLEAEEEFMLAKSFKEHGNTEAAHKLVTSHLRLVAKMAMGFRGYGLPLVELISEGNIGLMQAVKKFDPDKGFRLSTYAMWWIKASIQEYVLRSWSVVKVGTSAAQKKLFFHLKRIRARITKAEGDLSPQEVALISKELDVGEDDVIDMDRRMNGHDISLNQPYGDSENGDAEYGDFIADGAEGFDTVLSERQEKSQEHKQLNTAIADLSDREKDILFERRLREVPTTLEDLSQRYNISRERVRQIENRAFEKVQTKLLEYRKAG